MAHSLILEFMITYNYFYMTEFLSNLYLSSCSIKIASKSASVYFFEILKPFIKTNFGSLEALSDMDEFISLLLFSGQLLRDLVIARVGIQEGMSRFASIS